MMEQVTTKDLVLLAVGSLAPLPEKGSVPTSYTQAGLAAETCRSSATVYRALADLTVEGLVTQRSRVAAPRNRRTRTFAITPMGREQTRDLRARVLQQEIRFDDASLPRVTVARFLTDHPDLDEIRVLSSIRQGIYLGPLTVAGPESEDVIIIGPDLSAPDPDQRSVIAEIRATLEEPDDRIPVVIGFPGIGKRALIVQAAKEVDATSVVFLNPVLDHPDRVPRALMEYAKRKGWTELLAYGSRHQITESRFMDILFYHRGLADTLLVFEEWPGFPIGFIDQLSARRRQHPTLSVILTGFYPDALPDGSRLIPVQPTTIPHPVTQEVIARLSRRLRRFLALLEDLGVPVPAETLLDLGVVEETILVAETYGITCTSSAGIVGVAHLPGGSSSPPRPSPEHIDLLLEHTREDLQVVGCCQALRAGRFDAVADLLDANGKRWLDLGLGPLILAQLRQPRPTDIPHQVEGRLSLHGAHFAGRLGDIPVAQEELKRSRALAGETPVIQACAAELEIQSGNLERSMKILSNLSGANLPASLSTKVAILNVRAYLALQDYHAARTWINATLQRPELSVGDQAFLRTRELQLAILLDGSEEVSRRRSDLVALAARMGSHDAGRMLCAVANSLAIEECFDESLLIYHRALESATRAGDITTEAVIRFNLVMLVSRTGLAGEAEIEQMIADIEMISERIPLPILIANSQFARGVWSCRTGDLEGLATLDRACEGFEEHGFHQIASEVIRQRGYWARKLTESDLTLIEISSS